jgi:uncharacterized protein with GYD domain
MATYLMFGKYSADSIKAISAKRTGEAAALLQKHGGDLKSGYALLGEHDLVLIVELPGTEQAVKASVELSKMTGIAFTTSPAVSVEDFDKLMS